MYNPNTTDNQQELYDVVNEMDEVIGTATRQQVHSDRSLIHRATGVIVFNTQKQLLMQKRSMTKDMYPGFWVFSVGGHVDSSDTYENAVQREIQEELGVDLDIQLWEKILQKSDAETEFWQMYIAVHNGPFPKFNRIEAEEVRFFDLDELLKGAKNQSIPMPPNVLKLLPRIVDFVSKGKIDELFTKNEEMYVHNS